MIRTMYNQNQRQNATKSAQQLFRRIQITNSQESRISRSSKQGRNFPSLNSTSMKRFFGGGKSLDNSKQNIMFQSYLQKVSSASKIDQKLIVSNYLNLLRRDYDKMHKQTKQHLSSINIKKKDIDFIKERVKIQQQSIQNLQQNLSKKNEQMKNIIEKQQQVQTQRKTLDHIIFRMKKDQIYFKQFGRIFEGQLNQKRKSLKALKQSMLSEDEKIHKLFSNMQQMKQQFFKNQQFRGRKLDDYCEKLENIHQKQQFIQQRRQRTLQLQSIQSNDILKAKNMEMRNICLINKIADCLFESKIQHLIQKYSHIQNAFHTIQVKTSIIDPKLIANKFFSYEELTVNLLKSISHYEKELEEKTKRNEQLKQKFKKLQEKDYINDIVEEKKEVKKLTATQRQQLTQKHLLYQNIILWVERQAKRLKIVSNQQQSISPEDLIKKFSQICLKTRTQSNQLIKAVGEPQRYITPGIRIKKIIKQTNLDFRVQKMKQAQEIQDSNSAEDEFLKVARAGVKRNFLIKQKTMNIGSIGAGKQVRTQNVISDRKLRASDNH